MQSRDENLESTRLFARPLRTLVSCYAASAFLSRSITTHTFSLVSNALAECYPNLGFSFVFVAISLASLFTQLVLPSYTCMHQFLFCIPTYSFIQRFCSSFTFCYFSWNFFRIYVVIRYFSSPILCVFNI